MHMNKIYTLALLVLCLPLSLFAQQMPKYYQSNIVKVYDSNDVIYKNPFGGGLKFPVFAAFHLNGDDREDLVILDKVDNRILTYISDGGNNYIYRPEFERLFPDSLVSFLIFKDYNNDQKPDLFTYSNIAGAGITVYKNTSNDLDGVQFKVASEQIQTYDWGNYMFSYNLPLFQVDIPCIKDVDKDGDLDLLIFDELGGSWLKLYNNMSMELCGHADALIFTCIDHYWGEFYESDESNEVTLNKQYNWGYRWYNQNYDSLKNAWDMDTICTADFNLKPGRIKEVRRNPDRHIGSTLLAQDIDNDTDIDLLVGDIEFPGLLFLENGKADFGYTYNRMISNNLHYPQNSKPVFVPQMPAPYFIDIDHDGTRDLVFAPFDKDEIDTFKNLNQIWLYKNEGTDNDFDMEFVKDNFLQDEMIDLGGGSSPAFCDYDQDGDQDLFVVSQGDFYVSYHQADRIFLFENIGNSDTAIFKMIDDDYLDMYANGYRNLKPAFADIDSDGDQDLFFGRINGMIMFYENVAATGQKADFQLVTPTFESIDVGDYSAPYFADINQDSLLDLIIGEKRGTIAYYENTGTKTSPSFTLVSNKFGGIEYPSSEVYPNPVVSDLDSNGYLDLIVGAQQYELFYQYTGGKLFFYPDFNKDTNSVFAVKDSIILNTETKLPLTRSVGRKVSPAITNMDGDGIPDIICGGDRGGLILFNTNVSLFTVITANKDLLICPGDSITLDAGSGFDTYEWNTGANTQTITVDSAFTYSCKVTKGLLNFTAYVTVDVHTGILDAEFDFEHDVVDKRKVQFSMKNTLINTIYWDFGEYKDDDYSFEENPSYTYERQGKYLVCMTVSDICGGTDKECKEIYVQSSIEDENELGLHVHPNPFSDYLMIESDEMLTEGFVVVVSDLLGREKYRQELDLGNIHYLDLADLADGIYILQLIDKDKKERSYERILKK
jgi:hypothetical protein